MVDCNSIQKSEQLFHLLNSHTHRLNACVLEREGWGKGEVKREVVGDVKREGGAGEEEERRERCDM